MADPIAPATIHLHDKAETVVIFSFKPSSTARLIFLSGLQRRNKPTPTMHSSRSTANFTPNVISTAKQPANQNTRNVSPTDLTPSST